MMTLSSIVCPRMRTAEQSGESPTSVMTYHSNFEPKNLESMTQDANYAYSNTHLEIYSER